MMAIYSKWTCIHFNTMSTDCHCYNRSAPVTTELIRIYQTINTDYRLNLIIKIKLLLLKHIEISSISCFDFDSFVVPWDFIRIFLAYLRCTYLPTWQINKTFAFSYPPFPTPHLTKHPHRHFTKQAVENDALMIPACYVSFIYGFLLVFFYFLYLLHDTCTYTFSHVWPRS